MRKKEQKKIFTCRFDHYCSAHSHSTVHILCGSCKFQSVLCSSVLFQLYIEIHFHHILLQSKFQYLEGLLLLPQLRNPEQLKVWEGDWIWRAFLTFLLKLMKFGLWHILYDERQVEHTLCRCGIGFWFPSLYFVKPLLRFHPSTLHISCK